MGQYNKAVLTAAGENLIARTLAGEIQLNITKAKTSNYIYPAGTDFKLLTDMQGIKQTAIDPATAVYYDTMIQTRVLFSNEEIAATYYIHNIGLYAMDGTQEVLFCIVTAESPDEMPQYNGVASTSYIYNIQNVVQDADQLNITVNPSGTATIQDVLERVDATGGNISETVIETLDTVEDKYPVPAAGESVKRFFGKVLTFLRNIKPLTGDINIYVSTTGSDITGDGTSAKPFKTIKYALSIIPKDLGGYTAYIYVADGTYDEGVVISNFYNGVIGIIKQTNPLSISTNCSVRWIAMQYCSCRIYLSGLNLFGNGSEGACVGTNCADIIIRFLSVTSTDLTKIGFSFDACRARVENCKVINHNIALRSYNSYCGSATWTTDSTGNNIGLRSDFNSTIATAGAQPQAALVFQQYSGGAFIYESGTQITDMISYGLACTWGTITGGYIRHGNMNSRSMITIQIAVTLTTALSASSNYIITGVPTPSAYSVSVTHNHNSAIGDCYVDGGTNQIRINTIAGLAIGTIVVLTCTYMTNS